MEEADLGLPLVMEISSCAAPPPRKQHGTALTPHRAPMQIWHPVLMTQSPVRTQPIPIYMVPKLKIYLARAYILD